MSLPHPVFVAHHSFDVPFPLKTEPEWASKVDRWYQLDAFAYGLCEMWWRNHEMLGRPPSLLFLASPGASNATDLAFARSGATSPSKFVHTLPNVRASSLCQLMNWHGPLLCVQRDPQTIACALELAARAVGEEWPIVWVLSVLQRDDGSIETHAFVLRLERHNAQMMVVRKGVAPVLGRDRDFLTWLKSSAYSTGLPNGLELACE